MLYDGCLRFLYQAAYAMREGDSPSRSSGCAAPRRSSTSCSPTLDHEQGGEIASRLQGIYVFCRAAAARGAPRAGRRARSTGRPQLLAELREAWAQIAAPS